MTNLDEPRPPLVHRRALTRINRPFKRLAAALSRPHFLQFDDFAIWFYAVCAALFLVLTLCGVHGSCINIFRAGYHFTNAGDDALFTNYRTTRVDEWNYHTPAILHQLYRDRKLDINDTPEGPGKSALLANVPSTHFTEWFRPQFWAFHFLSVETAFAAYWQAKALLLLTGTFTLFLLLTKGASRLSALGALWFFFSTHTQWAYSWPSLLPEMIGLFGWIMCLNFYLLVGRRPLVLLLAAVASGSCMVNFALCAYPPQQIPLILFGLFLAAGWIWASAGRIFTWRGALARGLALAVCLGLTGTVLFQFYLDAKPTLAAAAATIYPGQRVVGGGGIAPGVFIGHLLDFWNSETHLSPILGNVSECTGYLWLAPVTLLAVGPRWRALPRRSLGLLLGCWVGFLLVGLWMCEPISPWLGHWFFLDKVPGNRTVHAVGLMNISIVLISLCRQPTDAPRATLSERAAWFGGMLLIVFIAVSAFNDIIKNFHPYPVLIVASLYAAALALCTRERWRRALALLLLPPLIWCNGPINPLARNLHVITKSALFDFAQQRPEYRRDKWIVFSRWVDPDGFFTACGLHTVNSIKVIPQYDDLMRFDPDASRTINQSGYVVPVPLEAGKLSTVTSPNPGLVYWNVSPLDPRLKEIGIRYVAFNGDYPPEVTAGLKPLSDGPISGMTLYELP